jgi:hypothetical protein
MAMSESVDALLAGVDGITDAIGRAEQSREGVEEVLLANVDAVHAPILPQVWGGCKFEGKNI